MRIGDRISHKALAKIEGLDTRQPYLAMISLAMIAEKQQTALRRKLLGLSPMEVTTERRRFQVDCPEKQRRIESIGSFFLKGYHAALECRYWDQLCDALDTEPLDYRGFAYEGASMGVGLLDRLLPWRTAQYADFLGSPRNAFPYLSHVGLGWALARIPGGMQRYCKTLTEPGCITTEAASGNSLLACLALDGYGFHQSYFAWETYVKARVEPRFLPPDALPVFRQGVGRSLSFVLGMDSDRIALAISRFPSCQQADVWSGVGLALAYAGGLSGQEVGQLLNHAAENGAALAQGVAFAAKARQRAGYVPEHTRLVCELVWRQPVEDVAEITDATLNELPLATKLSAYAQWRERIRQRFEVSREPTSSNNLDQAIVT